MQIRKMAAAVSALATAGFLYGCGGDGNNNRAAQPREVSFVDREPNDGEAIAQALDLIAPGDRFSGTGQVNFEDQAGDDEFDSYQFTAEGPQQVSVNVTHGDNVDIDIAAVDGTNGAILTEFGDADSSPETLAFNVEDGQTFNVEVEAFSGNGTYSVTIESMALGGTQGATQ